MSAGGAIVARPRWDADSPHTTDPARETFATPASAITLIRTVAALACAVVAVQQDSMNWLWASLLVYWIGDIADGETARRLYHETRWGAVLDIACDRLNAAAFYFGLMWLEPALAIPIAMYVAEFMTVDTVNSLAFLAWPIRSPNYFYEVDQPIWRWNWSRPAKAANSAIFALVLIWTHWVWLGILVSAVLWVIKLVTLRRLVRIGLPLPGADAWPAGAPADVAGGPRA